MTATERPAINVLDPQFYVDPWDAYRWLRDEAPVWWDPVQQLWAISRHEDILAVERNPKRYSSFMGSRPLIDQRADRSMINLDDPEHHRQKALVGRRFTPSGVRDHEAHVRGVVTEILDRVVGWGACEVVEDIASRLPAMVIGDMLGYPRDLWPKIRYWSEEMVVLSGQTSPDGPPYVQNVDMGPVSMDYFQTTSAIIAERLAEPRDDMISVWAHTEGWDMGRVLEENILVLVGGAETTRAVIGSAMVELARRPDQRRLLAEHPELLGTTAVEEFIRWVTPISNMRRTATEDHELHGQHIREGDQLLLLYGAANRDPRAFEDPDTFDVTRAHNRHVAFGFGPHFCLGSQLARLELRIMFEELLARMGDWELVDPDEPRIVPGTFGRTLDRIRIRYTPG